MKTDSLVRTSTKPRIVLEVEKCEDEPCSFATISVESVFPRMHTGPDRDARAYEDAFLLLDNLVASANRARELLAEELAFRERPKATPPA